MRHLLGRVFAFLSSGTVAPRQPQPSSFRAISQNRQEDLLWLFDCLCIGDKSRFTGSKSAELLESVSECVRTLAEEMLENVAAVGETSSTFEFSLSVQPSNVGGGAGDGLYVKGGAAKPGDLVAMYPGTVFYAEDVEFFGGIEAIFPNEQEREHFILRGDGILLDGQKKSLDFSQSDLNPMTTSDGGDVESTVQQSMLERVEALTRGNPVQMKTCDFAKNPFALAHKANHPPCGHPANVIAVPIDFDLGAMKRNSPHLLSYLPTFYALRLVDNKTYQKTSIASPSTVCFVASRDIHSGEEIYLDYATSPDSKPEWMGQALRTEYKKETKRAVVR